MEDSQQERKMNMQSCKPRNQEKRLLIMQYMISFATERGKQPSVREIGQAAGLQSTSTTAGYLRRMVNEGLLGRTTKTNRNYFVTRSAAEMLRDAG
jgi:repressor LexA